MPNRAQCRVMRALHCIARCALLMLCLTQSAQASDRGSFVRKAVYAGETDRYGHAVLGDDIEYTTLVLTLDTGEIKRFTLPQSLVFEDTAPRLMHTRGEHVIVVESHQTQGARLAVYSPEGRVAATPYIGTRYRWLAPLGAADLDGDGTMEIAYVDRPHLAKTLRIWRFENGELSEVANLPGLTNHRIGERDIAGGIRTCEGPPEMILAAANWSDLLALRYADGQITSRIIGQDTSRTAFARAMTCQTP